MEFNDKAELEPHEIPFMHYGIINRFNFKSIANIPVKRWDPLSFNSIVTKDFKHDVILKQNSYGHYSYISPIRAKRIDPKEKVIFDNKRNGSKPVDVFDPMLKGRHYFSEEDGMFIPAHAIVIADGNVKLDDPFISHAKVYQNLVGGAVSMINKFPAMVRVVDPEVYPHIIRSIEKRDKNSQLASGLCFLTIPKQFYERLEEMPVEDLKDLFVSMAKGIEYSKEEAFSQKMISSIPISIFFNIGQPVGGSQRRIHGQVYLDFAEDGHGARIDGILKSFDNMKKKNECQVCTSDHEEGKRLIISDDDDWVFFASGSPIRNYHIRFAPKSHIENFHNISNSKFLSLARILRILFEAMNELGINSNRNIIFNTKPLGYDSYFHIFGDILPYEFVGGAEMADDMRVVRTSPRSVAKELREIIKSK